MGEYAKRKKDGVEVKIGTCNELFYLRHDQLSDVEYSYNGLNCFFRIPNPDEDGIEAGDFENCRVFEKDGCIPLHLRLDESMFSCEEWKNLADDAGTFQIGTRRGLLVSVTCHHGFKLPESNETAKFFWNGKNDHLLLSFLKPTENELRVGIECAECGKIWSYSFDGIQPCIRSLWMQLRLMHQCAEYHMAHNDGEVPAYSVTYVDYRDRKITIRPVGPDQYEILWEDGTVGVNDWQNSRDRFIWALKDDITTYELKERYKND